MEWWGWVAWGVSIIIGGIGAVLGIRAERRATRYKPLWVAGLGTPARFINRTGEDAIDVRVELIEGRQYSGTLRFPLVEPNGVAYVQARGEDGTESFGVRLTWTRASNRKQYEYVIPVPEK